MAVEDPKPRLGAVPTATLGLANWQAVASSAVGVVALLIYMVTMYPDVTGGDSGELIGAVVSGGVIHPPGYPLYSLLGELFIHLPLRNPAWRLGLLSAVCGAGAAALLCLAAARWSRSTWAGVAAAGLFALSPGIWQYAVCAEVFALNNLLAALLFLLAVLYAEKQDRRYALGAAFVFGLALSNHHTILFVGLPLAAWFLWTGRSQLLRLRTLALAGGLFAAGLLPYLHLVLAGSRAAAVSWGATHTWAGFWTHLLRREYGTFQLAVAGLGAPAPASSLVTAWLRDLLANIGWWGALLAAVGLVASVRRAGRKSQELAIAVVAVLALSVLVFAGLANLPVDDPLHREIVARFWQLPELFFCAFCGLGIAALRRLGSWPRLLPTFAISLVASQGALHWRAMDRHENRLVRQYADEIMRVIPRDTLLLTKGDLITNTVRYLQVAEHSRLDVRVVDQELLGFPWSRARLAALHPEVAIPAERLAPGASGGYSIRELIDANIDRGPIVVCGGIKDGEASIDAAYALWPLGICERVHPRADVIAIEPWLNESAEALPRIEFEGQLHPPGSWEDIVQQDYWAARQMRAVQLIDFAGPMPERRPYLRIAADMLQSVAREDPNPAPLVYKTLALALGRAGLETPERKRMAAQAWRQYLQVAPQSDPMLPAIQREVQRLGE